MKKGLRYVIAALLLAGLLAIVRNYYHNPELPLSKTRLTTLDGRAWDPQKSKGKYLLISCVQSWCRDCIREVPSLAALQAFAGKNRLEVLLVSDEDPQKIRQFADRIKADLPIYQSAEKFSDLGIRVFPVTWLLDPEGKVLLTKLEGYDWNSAEVQALIP